MVLSNKKLKLKLRAELAQQQNQTNSNVVDVPSSSDSLKNLLDSATHTPRLSKREKLRKIRSLQPPHPQELPKEDEGGNKESGTEGLGVKKNKKRQRKVEDDDVANGVPNKSKNNKKLKNKNKKKKKKAKTAEEDNSNHGGETQEATELTKTNTITSQENGDVPTKVYVGGIPYYSTEDDIRSYFESCGTITEVDCMTFPESGKFRGIAIISFKTEAAAKRALALDGADMGGLFLKIQPYKATRANKAADFAPEIMEGYNRIYVGNLSWDITEEELRKFFKKCKITSLRFGMDKDTGEFKGYAHVDFSDSQSLKTALTLDQNVLFGRPVRISCAVPLKKNPGTHTSAVSKVNGVDGEKSSSTGSGKMRRRTCYECGEKGHILSACPKKQTVAATTT
ncbi:33 kDa ribonucleoprotein, chloroplastic isoform X1 [Abrus precatorius]|uniref:33 kDa ribonucleoprotein, chloroplastic isoform X1 n=1 Tax=Abrus precatorius TaxID=3816 RepID=A0A8B8MGU2_ABRPR|nr:33 kDa ribonucleoprotein, chloroplastic isoform X1 [Abrus precatorius]